MRLIYHDRVIWRLVAKKSPVSSVVNLMIVWKWFKEFVDDNSVPDDSIWKELLFRELEMGEPTHVELQENLTWKLLYKCVAGAQPYYCYRDLEPLAMAAVSRRIGGLVIQSNTLIAAIPRLYKLSNTEESFKMNDQFKVSIPNVLPGVWTADHHIGWCPYCDVEPPCDKRLVTISFLHAGYSTMTYAGRKILATGTITLKALECNCGMIYEDESARQSLLEFKVKCSRCDELFYQFKHNGASFALSNVFSTTGKLEVEIMIIPDGDQNVMGILFRYLEDHVFTG